MNTNSTIFTNKQMNAINSFIENILPYIKINGTIRGKNVIDECNAVGAGTYGFVITCFDFVIKVAKIDLSKPAMYYRELLVPSVIEQRVTAGKMLNYDPTDEPIYVNGLQNMIQTYGVVYSSRYFRNSYGNARKGNLLDSAEVEILNNKWEYLYCNRVSSNPNKFAIDTSSILPTDQVFDVDDELIFIISERGGESIRDKPVHPIFSLHSSIIGLIDALATIHHAGYIHCDIKDDNIIRSYDNKSLKIIDFGLTKSGWNGYDFISNTAVVAAFTKGTVFEKQQSPLYDWYCLFIALINECLKVSDMGMTFNNFCFPTMAGQPIADALFDTTYTNIDIGKASAIYGAFRTFANSYTSTVSHAFRDLVMLLYLSIAYETFLDDVKMRLINDKRDPTGFMNTPFSMPIFRNGSLIPTRVVLRSIDDYVQQLRIIAVNIPV